MRFAPIPTLALLDTRLTARDLTVMGAVTAHGDKEGYCWPSQGRLARGLGISRQAVGKSIANLKSTGWIETVRRKREDGGWMSDAIRVLFDFQPPGQYLRSFAAQGQLDFERPLQPGVAGGVQPDVAGGQPGVAPGCNQGEQGGATTGCTELTHEGINPPTCACAREGELPAGHEIFAVLPCAVGSKADQLTLCTGDIPGWQKDFPKLTAGEISEVLRYIGTWYRRVCRQPDSGKAKARFPHEWQRMVMGFLSEGQQNKAAGRPVVGSGPKRGSNAKDARRSDVAATEEEIQQRSFSNRTSGTPAWRKAANGDQ